MAKDKGRNRHRHTDHTRLPGQKPRTTEISTGVPDKPQDDEISQAHTIDIEEVKRSVFRADTLTPPLRETLVHLIEQHNQVAEQAHETRHVDQQIQSLRAEHRDDFRDIREQLKPLNERTQRNETVMTELIRPMLEKLQGTLNAIHQDQQSTNLNLATLGSDFKRLEAAHKATDGQIEVIKLHQNSMAAQVQAIGHQITESNTRFNARFETVDKAINDLKLQVQADDQRLEESIQELKLQTETEDRALVESITRVGERVSAFEVEKNNLEVATKAKTGLLRFQKSILVAVFGAVAYAALHFRELLAAIKGK